MNAYFDDMVLSASPVELVRLLFQRAISKVREARVCLREGRIEERAAAINSAYRIVAELMSSINAEVDPDLTRRLLSLYCYAQERLLEANLKQADAPLANALSVLGTLGEAWQAVEISPVAASSAAASSAAADKWGPAATAGILTSETPSYFLTA